MKVLRVVTLGSASGRYGGPFDTAIAQSRVMRTAGVDTSIVAGHLADDAPYRDDAPNLVTLRVRRALPLPGFAGLLSPALVRTLWHETRAADIVHVSFSREAIPAAAALIGLLQRKPLVLQPHGMLTARSSRAHRALDRIVRPLARRAAVMIALTDVESLQLRNWFRGGHPEIVSIGNPVQTSSAELAKLAGVIRGDEALWVARLHSRKRVDMFLAAAAASRDRGWAERYVVAGPDEGDLHVVQDALRRSTNLSYEGTLPGNAVPARVAQARLFVLTAENEPWGNVLITALALHVPVVVTSSSALAGAITAYGAGAVIKDGDGAGLAVAVHRLLTDEREYSVALAGATRLAADLLDDAAIARRLMDAYGRALMKEGGSQ